MNGDSAKSELRRPRWQTKTTRLHRLGRICGMSDRAESNTDITLREFQALIRTMYLEKDVQRGVSGTFMWLIEEIGELATALRDGDRENQVEEFADVLAWLTTIANVADIDLTEALNRKYGTGCPGCGNRICGCPDEGKP